VDEAALEALAPAFEDLARTCPVPASIVDEPWSDHGPSLMMLGPDGSGAGVWVDLERPAPQRVVHVADQVQEWAVEALWGAGFAAVWPACDLHPGTHPLEATLDGLGQPVWACPSEGVAQARIGRLPPSA
jgi:hypothetical protein